MKRLIFLAALLIASSFPSLAQPAKGDYKNINLVDTLEAAGNFKTLLIALDKAGLTDTLKGAGPITLFAPNDAAFAKLPPGVLDALMQNPAKLRRLLLYHVTAGKLTIKDFQSRPDKSITMMENTKATIEGNGGIDWVTEGLLAPPPKAKTDQISPANSESKAKLTDQISPALMVINKSARVVMGDLSASNGMIHGIDTVLAPGTHWLAVIGTAGYVSPELALGKVKEIDHRSDIFSFGCIMLEAVTAHRPFPPNSQTKAKINVIQSARPSARR